MVNSIELDDTKEDATDPCSTDGRVNLSGRVAAKENLPRRLRSLTPRLPTIRASTASVGPVVATTPNVDTVDTDGDSGSPTTDPTANGNRVLTPQAVKVHGVAVSATNTDEINTYSAAVGGGTVGVAVAAAVNVVNTDTGPISTTAHR